MPNIETQCSNCPSCPRSARQNIERAIRSIQIFSGRDGNGAQSLAFSWDELPRNCRRKVNAGHRCIAYEELRALVNS